MLYLVMYLNHTPTFERHVWLSYIKEQTSNKGHFILGVGLRVDPNS
jgi:hypothetical protein